jgi:putative restriction endonuclease
MFDRVHDATVRSAAFDWLSEQVAIHGDVLPRSVLAQGFVFAGNRIPLVGPQGIFKPRVLSEVPISITTAPEGPYDDAFGAEGLLRYRYRGTNRDHPDNRGLRFAMEQRLPLVYFHGIVPGKYLATWPVFIVRDDPADLFFSVAVDDATHTGLTLDQYAGGVVSDDSSARRAYITASVRQRLHQRGFRERVLEAYRHQCSFCRLRHEELLDAAHIIGDTEPQGEPIVRNGLSLCKLHHAAFDSHFIGVRPDYVLEVRRHILKEHDGPTLVHAIQELHGSKIFIPKQAAHQPSRELLEIRYERFRVMPSL